MFNFKTELHYIPEQEAPHLHAALEALCAKAGMEKPALVRLSPGLMLSDHAQEMMHWFIGATPLKTGKPAIIVGDKARAMWGHADLKQPLVGQELEAMLAHELGHIKHLDVVPWKMWTVMLTPAIGMAAAMGGYALYNHITKKTPADMTPDEKQKHQSNMLDQEIGTDKSGAHPTMLKLVKYTAAGLLGLASGITVRKLFHNHIEFRADKFSVELMGSAEPLAGALTTFKNHLTEIYGDVTKLPLSHKFEEWIQHPHIDTRISTARALPH